MYVYLENITVADIASEVVADYVERHVAFDPKTTKVLSFAIAGNALDPELATPSGCISTLTETEEVSQG